jgi:hypothetical protein
MDTGQVRCASHKAVGSNLRHRLIASFATSMETTLRLFDHKDIKIYDGHFRLSLHPFCLEPLLYLAVTLC